MKSIGERIKEARKSAGLTQLELAKKTELSRSYIGDIEKDRYNPSVSTLQLIATATNTPLEDLLPSTKTVSPTGRGVRIPVLGRVVAGIPIEAVEEILDYEEITPELAATGEFFALKIRGHSMEPRMMEGDVVIVRRQDDVDSGDVAIVLVNGDEATVKRVKKQEDGITLIANNISVYEPHYYSNKEIEELPVRILGKVVELRGKL
ncbi:LexA family protein [Megasphaera vaginalis (ex Srinivasan et al. 2021)]|uniref:DNA-binding helix-turn-helix protein n=1 Tax=Megasphaera vaginalis (ex Srinivasan et al. 2021) TaxID=1111454 RepID=U7UMG1_9FIRM|nr:XRE family transcriptional regulator [Megasphaera vaginalis (ex Srinivasan et al. 2021)]ERT60094.1 DNA-binding helix-turn-helix protein [Megasphaera vaginalis (ex Srinivasan et al. 2021)]